MNAKLLNLALYQAGWFCCVLGATWQRPWTGAALALTLVVVHLALVRDLGAELRLLALAGVMGAVADSIHSCSGLLEFRSGYLVGCLAPPWIVVMWLQFATLFRFGLGFLKGRYLLAAILGAGGGPLAFWAGSRLGAVDFPPPVARSLIVLAISWGVATPALALFAGLTGRDAGAYRVFKR